MKSHLSSEDLESALAGSLSLKLAEHVSGCAACAAEIAETRELFSNFRQSAVVLAERAERSAAAPPPRRRLSPVWGLATAALFLGAMLPVAQRTMRHPVPAPPPTASLQPAAPLSDDALLNSVQDDLTSSVPASLLPLAGASTQGSDLTQTEQRKTQ